MANLIQCTTTILVTFESCFIIHLQGKIWRYKTYLASTVESTSRVKAGVESFNDAANSVIFSACSLINALTFWSLHIIFRFPVVCILLFENGEVRSRADILFTWGGHLLAGRWRHLFYSLWIPAGGASSFAPFFAFLTPNGILQKGNPAPPPPSGCPYKHLDLCSFFLFFDGAGMDPGFGWHSLG